MKITRSFRQLINKIADTTSLDPQRLRMLKNTFFLYLLVFSGYFFALITVPYQTRVLGPELYGKLGWAMATMAYFSLVIEFGYLLSATEKIARFQDNRHEIEKIVGAVTINKLIFALAGLGIVAALAFGWDKMSSDPWFYLLCYAAAIVPSFMLDFFYRGIEEMQVITYRSVAIKAFFTVCIFIFLRTEQDYWVVPALNLVGGLGAVGFVYWHMVKKLRYRLVFPSLTYCFRIMRESAFFFISRIATTVTSNTNTFLLGFIYPPASLALGAYTSADKILGVMCQVFSPIADSLYPYMVKNKDYRFMKKVLIIAMPIIIVGCSVVAIFATPLCTWFLGDRFEAAGPTLALMMPIVAVTLPTYLFGYPALAPLGGSNAVNRSVLVGAAVHAILLATFFISGNFTVTTVVITTIVSEYVCLVYRIIAFMIYRKRPQIQAHQGS